MPMDTFSKQIYKLIYVSTSRTAMEEEELITLLEHSRAKNHARNITGLLIYHQTKFFQLLEGSKAEIDHLFGRIKKDPRHEKVVPLIRELADSRDFPDWSMGFKRLDQLGDSQLVEGFNQILEVTHSEKEVTATQSEQASSFLSMFKSIAGIG